MWHLTVVEALPSTVGSTSAVRQDKLCLDNVPREGKACMTVSTMIGMSLAVSSRGVETGEVSSGLMGKSLLWC